MSVYIQDIVALCGVEQLWYRGHTGADTNVAIVDTGIDQNKVSPPIIGEFDVTDDETPADLNGHGTNMANYVRHFAPDCGLINAKAVNRSGRCSRKEVSEALDRAAQDFPQNRLINISLDFDSNLGLGDHPRCDNETPCELCQVVARHTANGKLIVVAAGNRGPETYCCPANAEGVLAVMASRFEDQIELGHGIKRWWLKTIGHTVGDSGTSISAAMVTGQIATLLSAFPDVTMQEIIQASEKQGPTDQSLTNFHVYRMYKAICHLRTGASHPGGNVEELKRRADDAEQKGQLDTCIGIWRNIIETMPWAAGAYVELSRLYLLQRDYEHAVLASEEAVNLDRAEPSAVFNYGLSLFEFNRQFAGLINILLAVERDERLASNLSIELRERIDAIRSRRTKSGIEMYIVYERPLDFPDEFVFRKHRLGRFTIIPCEDVFARAESIHDIRAKIPQGLDCYVKPEPNEPQMLELWI